MHIIISKQKMRALATQHTKGKKNFNAENWNVHYILFIFFFFVIYLVVRVVFCLKFFLTTMGQQQKNATNISPVNHFLYLFFVILVRVLFVEVYRNFQIYVTVFDHLSFVYTTLLQHNTNHFFSLCSLFFTFCGLPRVFSRLKFLTQFSNVNH